MYKFKDGVKTPLTAAEIAEVNLQIAEQEAFAESQKPINVRSDRDYLLKDSDWTQASDYTGDALTAEQVTAWATYRQALRDITAHENFPDLAPEDWPTKP